MLLVAVGAVAVDAESVEGRDSERCREVAVADAARLHVPEVDPDLGREPPRMLQQRFDRRILLLRRPDHSAGDLDLDIGVENLVRVDARLVPARRGRATVAVGHVRSTSLFPVPVAAFVAAPAAG